MSKRLVKVFKAGDIDHHDADHRQTHIAVAHYPKLPLGVDDEIPSGVSAEVKVEHCPIVTMRYPDGRPKLPFKAVCEERDRLKSLEQGSRRLARACKRDWMWNVKLRRMFEGEMYAMPWWRRLLFAILGQRFLDDLWTFIMFRAGTPYDNE